jgi:hypothetical protein
MKTPQVLMYIGDSATHSCIQTKAENALTTSCINLPEAAYFWGLHAV